MRICIVTSSFPMNNDDAFAAAGKACRDFSLELEIAGHEVYVFAPKFKGLETSFGRLKIKRFSWGGSGKRLSSLNPFNIRDIAEIVRFFYFGKKELVNFISDYKIEKVFAMWAVPGGLFALLVKKKMNIPYSVWALGADIWVYGKLPVLKNVVKKVLVGAEFLYADGIELCKDVKKISGKKCKFLPHVSIVKIDQFTPVTLNSGKTNFLFIGRLEAPKGIDILIDALNLFVKEEKNIHLFVIGDGPYKKMISAKVSEKKSEKYVSLLGWVEQKTLVSYLKSCDVLVIPSRIESIPCVYSEAMTAGIPVIASDVGDMGFITKKYNVGRVARPRDPLALKNEMKAFLKDDRNIFKQNTSKLANQWKISTVVQAYLNDIQ